MQLINEAYSILSDPIKRKEYNRTWESKNISSATAANHQSNPYSDSNANSRKRFDRRFLSAKALLEEYFDSLMKGDYSHSYDMISEPDKSNISKSDFIHWQTAVSKVYCIKECKCDLHGIYQDKLIRGTMYGDVLEFNVNTLEHNLVMDMMQKDNVTKLLLQEKGEWKVYLGYEKLEPIINKFNDLRGLLNAKTVLNELAENRSRMDNATGLMNQRGLIEIVEREILRQERYHNVFSLIICEIDVVKRMHASEEQEIVNHVLRTMGELLITNLRKLDLVGRWDTRRLLIVLPETGLMPAIKVSHKMQKLFKEDSILNRDKNYKLVIDFGVTEYYSSLEETLDRIYNQL
jgi:diguanylate cyclase (GGDEF)-like protein